jgi:hypothetical protein
MADSGTKHAESVLDEPMVRGYLDARDGLSPRGTCAAYKHGYERGIDDRTGRRTERTDVLRRRADMILGTKDGGRGSV